MVDFTLTIQSILTRKHFEQVQVIAGEKGLTNSFKWIHILETLALEELLKGEELILTTGIHLKNETDFLCFIEKLAQSRAAGLCIECAEHIQSIPDAVIQRANELALPILVFPHVVPFVEITQDLHRQLINQQYEILQRLETYGQELQQLTLHITNYDQLLIHLQKYLNLYVVFELNGETPVFLPNIKQEHYEQLKSKNSPQLLSKDLYLMRRHYGTLTIYSSDSSLGEFEALILDRTVVTLANYILRDLYIDQRTENENRLLLTQWIQNELSPQALQLFLQDVAPKTVTKQWTVMIQRVDLHNKKDNLTYQKLVVRTILEKHGFSTLTFEKGKDLVFLIADLWDTADRQARMQSVVAQLLITRQKANYYDSSITMGIGQFVQHFNDVPKSYTNAHNTLRIRKQQPTLSYFFEEIPLQHMLLHLRGNESLMTFAQEVLAPLLAYDQAHNGQLVKTLKTYLAMNGLKKETAQALFIVRQTLYHRLEKIENLLGKDYLIGDKRLAIEMMLHLLDEPIST